MNRTALVEKIKNRRSYLCVGLDTDPEKLPTGFKADADGMYEFNKAIIDATREHCVAYKINTAFYEAVGANGWRVMEKTAAYIGGDHFKIADAKRGDIGNTSDQYAKAFFKNLPFDAVTLAPYMGSDSVQPFLHYPDKWAIVLGLTSNRSAADFELQACNYGFFYEKVITTASQWGTKDNTMFVVGATQPEAFLNIRRIIPDHFLLVPGVGAQGGSLKDISAKAMNKDVGLLVNASRAIIYAGNGPDFAEKAAMAAKSYQQEMGEYLLRLPDLQ